MKNIAVVLGIGLLATLLVGCPSQLSPDGTERASVTLRVNNGIGTNTLTPTANLNLNYLDITFSKDGQDDVTLTNQFFRSSYSREFTLTAFGTWTVTVDGKNGFNGEIIARDQKEIDVSSATSTESIEMVLTPLTGNGELSVSLGVPAADVTVDDITVAFDPVEAEQNGVDLELTETDGSNALDVVISSDSIPAGYYLLSVTVAPDEVNRYGRTEVVRILEGKTTSASWTLTSDQADGFSVPAVSLDPEPGTYDEGPLDVTLTPSSPNTSVHYTLSGLDPTGENGTVVAEGESVTVSLGSTTTIKAKAISSSYGASEIVEETYTIAGTTPTPTVNLNEGLYFTEQTLTASNSASDNIRYTDDGSDPTESSSAFPSGGLTLNPETDYSLKIVATPDLVSYSDVITLDYQITGTVADPQFSVPSGTLEAVQSVTLTTTTEDATIYYTLDGTQPTAASRPYPDGGIEIEENVTVKAIAVRDNWGDSQVVDSTYEFVVDAATASPASRTFGPDDDRDITLQTPTDNATIFYTLDGTAPSSSDSRTAYTDPITIEETDTELRFVATRDGWTDSTVGSETYVLKLDTPVAAPVTVDPGSTGTTITLTNSRDGARALYTTDGQTPTLATASTDTFPFDVEIDAGQTLKVIARDSGWDDSDVLTVVY